MARSFLLIGWAAQKLFAIFGFIVAVILGLHFFSAGDMSPSYRGQVYDCRTPNWGALAEVSRLMNQGHYAPTVVVYQYRAEDATVVSLDFGSQGAAFILRSTEVTVGEAVGVLPAGKSGNSFFDLAQR